MFDLSTVINSLGTVISIDVLGWVLLGVIVGCMFGAIPGLTATTGIALFTPMTFGLNTILAIAFLLGLFCGGLWAGSIPAILIKTPGAPGNAATTLDGYPMAQQGRSGEAMFYSITCSWFGGTFSAFILLFFAPLIARAALKFGPAEYCAVALFGLSCIAALSGENLIKGVISGLIGMLIATIGMDPVGGVMRFTFDNLNLIRGIKIVPALVGLFALSEVLLKAEIVRYEKGIKINAQVALKISEIKRYLSVLLHNWITVIKSAVIGTIVGAIPGTGAATASWISYNEAVRSSKNPQEFGKGAPQGIIASESANNAISGGALIPLLTLGIPGDAATAVLLGALTIQGITPGAKLVSENFGLVANILWILIIGNFFMLFIGLFGSKYFPKLLNVSQSILMPLILVFCVAGSFASGNNAFDCKVALVLGVFGWFMMKFGFPVVPMVLGLVLGPIFEPNLRRALVASKMDWTVFFTQPISCAFIIISVVCVVLSIRNQKKGKKTAEQEIAEAEEKMEV